MKTKPTSKKRARRNWGSTLVDPFKQVRIGVYVLGLSLIFLVVAAVLISQAFFQQYGHVMEIFNVVDPAAKWELVTNDIFYANAIKLGLLTLVYVVVLFTVVFRMTHKMYGPLVGIDRFLDQLAHGDYSKRLVIRRGDDLQDLANKLNALAVQLEGRYGSQKGGAVDTTKSSSF